MKPVYNSSDLSYDEQVKALLMKINLNSNDTSLSKSTNLDVDFPQVIEFLPHLANKAHLVSEFLLVNCNK